MSGQTVLKGLVTLLVIGGILFLLWYLSNVVTYVLLSAVLAVVGRPLVNLLAGVKLRGRSVPRWLAAAATLLVIWIVGGGFCSLFLPLVFDKLRELATLDWNAVLGSIEEPMMRLQRAMHDTFGVGDVNISEAIREYLMSNIDINFLGTFASIASSFKTVAIALFSVSFITFYFLKEEGLFRSLVAIFFPDKYRSNVYHALNSINKLLSRYFGGLMVESTLLMTIISSVLMLFGMSVDNALFIGFIMGIMNLVPYAGPVIGCMLSVLVGIVTPLDGDMLHTFIVIVGVVITVKLIDDFVVQPTLYSERVQAHPLEIFLVILVAGSVAGMVGMLLAIPLYTVVRVFAREFFSEYSVVRRFTGQMDN